MKKIILALMCIIMLSSCADEKTFLDEKGKAFTATPYGWFTKEDKIKGVDYELSTGNIVLSVIFSETLVVPILLTGMQLYEPVNYNQDINIAKDTIIQKPALNK